MAATLDDLAQKFAGFELMMKQTLDKVSGIEAWQSSAGDSMSSLLTKADDAGTRLHRLETAPPPPPAAARPPPPRGWINPFDLNLAPLAQARPSASSAERPNGHR